MTTRPCAIILRAPLLIALLLAATSSCLFAVDPVLKLEALLVWGTNDAASPDPKHKPVEPAIRKKLQELPLKWNNYFEVSRKAIEVPGSSSKKVSLSEKCDVEVKNLGGSTVEVSLFGRGSQVLKRNQSLPPGETLVLAGKAPNETAWLVVIKRVQ